MYKKILKKITALFLAGAMVLPGLTVRAGSEDEIAVNTEENVTIDREHFPDEKFRSYIDTYIDWNHDGVLSQNERSSVKYISVTDLGITDLSGIEYFPLLVGLSCSTNSITTLDLSANTALEMLYCSENGMTSLNISGCTALQTLACGWNELDSLDLSQNVNLVHITCEDNNLASLDLSRNKVLEELYCGWYKLTSLDLSQNTKLTRLSCYENHMKTLELGNNQNLSLLLLSNQTISMEANWVNGEWILDMSQAIEKDKLTRLTPNHGDYDAETGILVLPEGQPDHIQYEYETNSAENMSVEVEISYNRSLPFVDVNEGDWFYDTVYYNYFEGLMTGLDPIHFGPADSLARAQFAVILWRMNGSPEVEYKALFPDVQDGIWYTDAILWAESTGVVTGYTNTGMFGPADKITREQMAVMMYRYAKYLKYDVGKKEDFSRFEDAAMVSRYAEDAMQWAVGNGIITGKNNGTIIDPLGNAARAECAAIIQRFISVGNE